MDILRWGVIGTGNIVRGTMAPAMRDEPTCDLVAAAARSLESVQNFASEFGVPHFYTDVNGLLSDPDVDAVFIGTPNALHSEQVEAAAAAGKHVLCDKPVALSAHAAKRALVACERAGVKYGVNFHNRHLPWVQDVAQLIAEGAIGDILMVQVEVSAGLRPPTGWKLDPAIAGLGTVYNQGVHVFDFLRVILGDEARSVMAILSNEGGRYSVDTAALALLRFGGDVTAFVNSNQSVPYPTNDIDIYGTSGRISGRHLTRSRVGGELHTITAYGETVTAYPPAGAHRRCLAAYTDAVLNDRLPDPSGLDGLRSVQLCAAIQRSSAEGRLISVDYES